MGKKSRRPKGGRRGGHQRKAVDEDTTTRALSLKALFGHAPAPGGSGAATQGHRIKAKMELTDETRPRAISVALANVKAAFDAIPPHQNWLDYQPAILAAIVNLRETILIDKDDRADFDEYMDGLSRSEEYMNQPADPELLVTTIACWPRFRKHWPRMRRRICSYCGKRSDPAEPRLLVCGGCGSGHGVGRYCSEECQREHWPVHRKVCPILHVVMPECRPLRKMKNTELRGSMKKAMKELGFARSPEEVAEIRAEISQE